MKSIPQEIRDKIRKTLTGRKMPQSVKDKISIANKNKLKTAEWKRNISKALTGRSFSEEHCNRISKSKKGKKRNWIISISQRKEMSNRRKGDKNPMWKGGLKSEYMRIRASLDFKLWRMAVFSRDEFKCRKCGVSGTRFTRLNPHHIKNFSQYPELRFELDNGITLCQKCHQEFHKRFDTKNNCQEQIGIFLGDVPCTMDS